MTFSIATWNINSVRLRLPSVLSFLERWQPDVLCLQETKCPNDQFPSKELARIGYPEIVMHGQKGYHGVATISRHPVEEIHRRDFCGVGDSRHLDCLVRLPGDTIRVHNFYVPAGGDEPDRTINPKFAHKLDFLDEMRSITADPGPARSALLVGDLNIAPLETDVWSHKQLLRVVSHTPVETETLEDLRTAGRWSDLMRVAIPAEEKVFTWWSYRAKDWEAANRGRRLDHVWGSPDLEPALTDVTVLREARGWERPSDHVPVIATFAR